MSIALDRENFITAISKSNCLFSGTVFPFTHPTGMDYQGIFEIDILIFNSQPQ